MKLLTKAIEKKLKSNNLIAMSGEQDEPIQPVLKLFNPCGSQTWLISDMDEYGYMFGLCDLGMGCPELGYVMLEELESVNVGFGLGIERDIHWEADKTLIEYADEARENERIMA
jgi:hypothetical protein